jgi:hypothetical protein
VNSALEKIFYTNHYSPFTFHLKIPLLTPPGGGIIPLRVRMMGVALFLKGKERK